MARYRKKPVVIDALRWPGEPEDEDTGAQDEFGAWVEGLGAELDTFQAFADGTLAIYTLEGEMTAQPGDMVIRGIQGEFYPCKPDIFEQTYEIVED